MPTSPAVLPDEEVQKNISKVEDAEIGQNLDFERHWSKVQNIAWIVFAAFLLGGLLGVFGKGPLAKATAGTSQDPFYAQYDRFARYMTTSNLHFVITPSARIENGTAQIFISEDLVKTLRTEQINPHPLWAQLSKGGVVFGFKATPGANMTIQFVQSPQKFGGMTSQLGLANERLLKISQFIYP
jgi:hypothetical protein